MSIETRKGAMYNYINLLLITVTGAVLTPFVIRSLGTSQYGLYALMGGMIPYVTLLDMGLGKTITRYVSYYRAHNNADGEALFLATVSRLYAIVVVILLLLGACLHTHVDAIWGSSFTSDELHDVRRMLLVIIVTQAIIVPGSIFTSICYGCGFFAFPRGLQPIKYVVRTVCVVALLLCGHKALSLIVMEGVLNIMMVIATYVYVKRHIGRKHITTRNAGDYRPILSYAGWIALYATICTLQWNIAQVVAGVTFDARTVGIVGVGLLLGNMYGYFAETINRMMMPRASRLIKENPTATQVTDEMIKVCRCVALIQVGILGVFIVVGKDFVRLWAGEVYEQAYYIALIMMTSWTVQLSQDYGNALLEAKGCVRVMSVINFICIFVAVIASYYTARLYGMVGMMCSLAVGTLLVTIVSNIYYHYRLQLQSLRYFRSVYTFPSVWIGTCVATRVILTHCTHTTLSWQWLTVSVVACTLVYTAITYSRILTHQERHELNSYVQRKRT